MNQFIKKQLQKCKVAVIPEFSDDTTEIMILRNNVVKKVNDYEVGYGYQIYVDDSLIKPCDWYRTLHGNWNNGVGPKSNTLNITIIQTMGKMIKVDSVDAQSNHWTGWLPKGNVKKLKEF